LPLTGTSPLPECLKSYCGCDTNKSVIGWCERHIRTKYRNCYFTHLTSRAVNHLPYASESFDVVLAKSLFTHLLKKETENYLNEIKRLLQPGGHCLATFFLLDGRKLIGKYTFENNHGIVKYERESNPKLAVAYETDYLYKLLKKLKLSSEVWYGTWRGDGRGLSYQDIIVMRKQQ